MEMNKIEACLESVLFSIGDAIHIDKLAEIMELDARTTRNILNNMADKYEHEGRGIKLIELDDSFQLCSKPEYYDYIRKISNKVKDYSLTDVLIETLSIIAYKQPITKVHIEEIRGVNSNHAVNKLVEYQLVEEIGRMNAPGRPVLFGTSHSFLRYFGLQSIDELPSLNESQIDSIKDEAAKEVQLKLME
jgi:segregation and condensation protein B